MTHWRTQDNDNPYRPRNAIGSAILTGALFGLALLVGCTLIGG